MPSWEIIVSGLNGSTPVAKVGYPKKRKEKEVEETEK